MVVVHARLLGMPAARVEPHFRVPFDGVHPSISKGLKNTTPLSAMPIGPIGTRVMWSANFGSNGNRNVNFCTRMEFGFPLLGNTAVGWLG